MNAIKKPAAPRKSRAKNADKDGNLTAATAAPSNMVYDKTLKAYKRTAEFKRVFP